MTTHDRVGSPVRLPAWRTVVYEVALNGWRILRETVNDFSLWRIIEYPWATKALELRRGDLVLDVGSGTSSYPHMLAKEGVDVVVLELDAARVRWQLAKRRATARPGDGRFFPLVASATQMPIRDGSVARIAAVSSLEHIPDDVAAGRELGRVLAPGGIAALTLPYTRSERRAFFAGIRRFVQVEPNAFVQEGKAGSFFRFYTDEDLQRVYVRPWGLAMGRISGFGRSLLNWRYHETRMTRYWRRFVLKDLLLAWIVHPLEERFDRSEPLYVMFTLRKR
ncbi:class I SAM-dependent methyltransferase [Candidatus Viridilinea mediisalina]|uniref:Methyltransferase type 11 n=1 Tax=Candidatus Viridilinea mediisalina TaxID=2024553 RepID=A0A2A6REU8_9CHLR|nr:class I SAM-dependent methyltransferase [Candidatus Viridilinea mediisalina]PDW01654.1 methyltransferase type 11 [Candidatus Viridilinea mediisalina]